jgi:hypothetical protein
VFELAVIVALWTYYWRRSTTDPTFGGRPFVIAAVLMVLHVFNSPWLSQL